MSSPVITMTVAGASRRLSSDFDTELTTGDCRFWRTSASSRTKRGASKSCAWNSGSVSSSRPSAAWAASMWSSASSTRAMTA